MPAQKKPIEFCFSSKQIESVLENNKQRETERDWMLLQLIETNLFVYEEWKGGVKGVGGGGE